jgi:hypothetical protein
MLYPQAINNGAGKTVDFSGSKKGVVIGCGLS